MTTAFGAFLRNRRLETGATLRGFAKVIGMQPSNYCNVEAGSLPPPKDDILHRIAGALNLNDGEDAYAEFFDLASEGRGDIPADVKQIIDEREYMPAMLRTIKNHEVSEERLLGLIEEMKEGAHKTDASSA